MFKDKSKKVGKGVFKILTGFIVGGAIGSILGLTLAPKKGSETRQAIRDKSMDVFLRGKTELKKDKNIGFFKKIVIKVLKPKSKNEVPH